MKTKLSTQDINRRKFLKLTAIAGAMAAGGYLLSEYTPWLDYAGYSNDIRTRLGQDPGRENQIRELVRYATLAASGHNTQPWKFICRENSVEIHPDYARRLPVVDPEDRELWISLGCALENFLISARAVGYAPNVTYPDSNEFINIDLDAGTPQVSPLFEAIPLRQNTRAEYDGQKIDPETYAQLESLEVEPGVELVFATDSHDLNTILEYVNQGNLEQYADPAFLDELITWLRFNKKEALSTRDGLFAPCSGNPEVPRWFGKMFVTGTTPQQQADLDANKLRASAGAVLITSAANDQAAWVRTGQVYERLALKMTTLNVKSAFLNQPIEIPELRSEFQKAMGLGEYQPQLLLRFGSADAMSFSIRRPIDDVLSF